MFRRIRQLRRQARLKLGYRPYRNAEEVTVSPDALGDIDRLAYWASEHRFARINLPIEIVVMEGAFAYRGGYNPLIDGLQDGAGALARFYEGFQPVNLAERYRIASGETGADLPLWWFPWIYPMGKLKPKGEEGLGPEHGFSTYGPVTPEKLALEVRRLDFARRSIAKAGYRPDIHDDISGFFLKRGEEFRFVVRGGKHRAAVLAATGAETLPVRMKRGWPRLIDRRLSADWPAVRAGEMSEAFALAFFDVHFERPGKSVFIPESAQ